MISAWWLLLIVPACTTLGMIIMSVFNINGNIDRCNECQFNYYKEKSE